MRAKEIIAKINYVTIATITPTGLPWNSPVYFAHDDHYNFYWGTYKNSQKAQNLASNRHVFLVIYDSTVPSAEAEGVYIQATAHQITASKEIKAAYELLNFSDIWDFSAVSPDGPILLYKAIPEKAWMNDSDSKDGHYIDTRTEISL
jgi:general stress protein 26